jgi:RNA chaperone Hfq
MVCGFPALPASPLFDAFTIMLIRDLHAQLVYKTAISTVMPASPITEIGSHR